MAARRNVLHGASSWEREERTNQQRDYAAQLQQQVQLKHAQQEQEKARKQQEQREELEMLERERATATRKRQPQQEELPPDPQVSAQSPQRAVSLPYMPMAVDSQMQGAQRESPLKPASTDPNLSSAGNNSPWSNVAEHSTASVSTTATYGVSDSHVPVFSSAPSIFESLLREPGIGARSIAFYDDLAALQRLTAELESAAKLRHTKAQQSNYVKPNFVHQQEVSAVSPSVAVALRSPVKVSENKVSSALRVKQDDNQLERQHAVPQIGMHLDGLLGESVLLPLSTAMQPPSQSFSQGKTASQQRFATAGKTEHEMEDDTTTMEALDNHSEMLHFSPTES
ncbi:uncharacterized protein KRP23_12953 [Phytophthora ramorum]|uniref:uncharacterized protein n=1 Tax=Phytophthora ramorum TaxID=164328 RepID=UPI0030AFB56E|nr:hypothetical protein KRP23_12953 [Phytophthora ramorum]